MGEEKHEMTAAVKTTPAIAPDHVVNARVTYRNAPIHLLEKFTFKDIDGAHKAFLGKADFEECVILQTCNRVEVFVAAKDPDEARLIEEWASSVGLPENATELGPLSCAPPTALGVAEVAKLPLMSPA